MILFSVISFQNKPWLGLGENTAFYSDLIPKFPGIWDFNRRYWADAMF